GRRRAGAGVRGLGGGGGGGRGVVGGGRVLRHTRVPPPLSSQIWPLPLPRPSVRTAPSQLSGKLWQWFDNKFGENSGSSQEPEVEPIRCRARMAGYCFSRRTRHVGENWCRLERGQLEWGNGTGPGSEFDRKRERECRYRILGRSSLGCRIAAGRAEASNSRQGFGDSRGAAMWRRSTPRIAKRGPRPLFERGGGSSRKRFAPCA